MASNQVSFDFGITFADEDNENNNENNNKLRTEHEINKYNLDQKAKNTRKKAVLCQWAISILLFMPEGCWSKPHRELCEVARHQTSPKFSMRYVLTYQPPGHSPKI